MHALEDQNTLSKRKAGPPLPKLVGAAGQAGGEGFSSLLASPRESPHSLLVALEMAPALRICRVNFFRFMMENGPRDWAN